MFNKILGVKRRDGILFVVNADWPLCIEAVALESEAFKDARGVEHISGKLEITGRFANCLLSAARGFNGDVAMALRSIGRTCCAHVGRAAKKAESHRSARREIPL